MSTNNIKKYTKIYNNFLKSISKEINITLNEKTNNKQVLKNAKFNIYYHITEIFNEKLYNLLQKKKIVSKSKINKLLNGNKNLLENILKCIQIKGLREERKSPVISATCFDESIELLGLDGKVWIKKGKIWISKHLNHTNHELNKDGNIISFKLKLKSKIKKISELNLTSNKIGIGEYIIFPEKAITKKYNIYKYKNSLIAIPSNKSLNMALLSKITWKLLKNHVGVDVGTFGYWDYNLINKITKKKRKNILFIQSNILDGSTSDIFKIKDLDNISKKYNPNNVFGVVSSNGSGDGEFNVYHSNGIYLIISDKLLNELDDDISFAVMYVVLKKYYKIPSIN